VLERGKGVKPRVLGRVGVPLALSAGLVAAVACNSSGSSGSGSSGSSGDSAGIPKITIGLISPGTSQTPLFVALQEGFFKKAGLDVTAQNLSGGTPSAIAAFATGSVNMLAAGSTEFIEYTSKKVISGKMFAELADQNYDIVVSKEITSIQQLKDKTIGISSLNGADQIYLEAVLAKNGMSDKDVTFITSGSSTNRLTALSTGSIQGIAVSNANRDTSNKTGTILLKSGDSPVQVPSSMLFASDDLITKHKALLTKFVAALSEASMWLRANVAAAAADCAKGSGDKVETCASAIAINIDPSVSSKFTWSSTCAINTAGVKSALAVMATFAPETKNLTVADVVDTSIAGTAP
jgi:NitT/TauT family transport system substrate-binding protein